MAIKLKTKAGDTPPDDTPEKKPSAAVAKKKGAAPAESMPWDEQGAGGDLKSKNAKATITTHEKKSGAETFTEEHLYSVSSDQPLCNVGFSAGATRNLGDYNSFKVQVSINIPVPLEGIDTALAFGQDWVNRKMEEVLNQA